MPRNNSKSSKKYVIGVDFGTLSARAILVDGRTGKELGAADWAYRNGVIEEALPGGAKKLEPHAALQDPADYLEALEKTVPALLRKTGIRGEEVAAIGTDFTSCTVLPVSREGIPLCFEQKWKRNPHAWVKLWKHHSPQPQADRINAVARDRTEPWLAAYGGKYSSEWFFSKVLETVEEAPEVYKAAGYFAEAGDWIVWQLTGKQTRCVSAAGFKGMRVAGESGWWDYPPPEYFKTLHPLLENVVAEKLGGEFIQLGSAAGGLSDSAARQLKLAPGTPVASGNIDAHAAVPACGVTEPGALVMMMGTSTCHLLIGKKRQEVEGICGVVEDGVVPGYWGYEAGQAGVGDLFAWYVEHGAPARIAEEARRGKSSVHQSLTAAAGRLKPGESGLLALDWWNGNRSVLVDARLTGVIVGLTLRARPHEIYRALLESTAFGTRTIIEAFENKKIPINRVFASGGLAQKNPLLMQIYADVLQRPIAVSRAEQGSAFGAAMHAAVAGGLHADIHSAARKMVRAPGKIYKPEKTGRKSYDALYREYQRLHDYFGRDAGSPMRELRKIQEEAIR